MAYLTGEVNKEEGFISGRGRRCVLPALSP